MTPGWFSISGLCLAKRMYTTFRWSASARRTKGVTKNR
ncbi:MAG: hypothetical protein BWX71_02291 [Deltaproteobacteria bacterium ADurb.Bin072]|nr:MAG: hypothetical protein BWX71_02291 [Deltaproteobacteria bacterium ADurb.Bin072]